MVFEITCPLDYLSNCVRQVSQGPLWSAGSAMRSRSPSSSKKNSSNWGIELENWRIWRIEQLEVELQNVWTHGQLLPCDNHTTAIITHGDRVHRVTESVLQSALQSVQSPPQSGMRLSFTRSKSNFDSLIWKASVCQSIDTFALKLSLCSR